jgi:predicted nucleic acid-binding protein
VHFDTVALIYFIEKNSKYLPLLRPVFRLIAEERLEGISSFVSLLEVLVKPLKDGRFDLAHEYREVLLRSRNFGLFAMDEGIAEAGAEIRARFSFKTPDAIQLATARRNGAEAFITNDHGLKRFDQVEVLVLDDFVGAAPLTSGGS